MSASAELVYTTGTSFCHQLEKTIKMRINDIVVIKSYFNNGILDVKYTQQLSSQVQVQHTKANSK